MKVREVIRVLERNGFQLVRQVGGHRRSRGIVGGHTRTVTVPVIASGGAGSLDHLYEAFTDGEADAVLAASIFHFGVYTIDQAKDHLASRGVPVRRGVA